MTNSFQNWNVLPHGKLSEIDDGILTIVGRIRMPLGSFPRRMTVVRLSDSRLNRILVSHGEPIEANPRQTLRDLAGSL